MIINRLATSKIVPESQWKKAMERSAQSKSLKSTAKRAAIGTAVGVAASVVAGPAGIALGAMTGALWQEKATRQTVTPSAEECAYRARWSWNAQDAQLVSNFAAAHPSGQKGGIFAGRTMGRTQRKLAKVKAQKYELMYDNNGIAANDGNILLLGIGDQGISFFYKDAAEQRQVYVPWEYFINRPIFVGQAWCVLEEHEMGDKFEMQSGDGCYVGDYMLFGCDMLEKAVKMTIALRELQTFLRSRCQKAER